MSRWDVAPPPVTLPGSTVVKLIAIYDSPDDPVAFFHHYEAVHAPLVKKTPGLQSFVLNRITGELVGGAPPYSLIAEMTYPDRATFDAAMKSPENAAVGQDTDELRQGQGARCSGRQRGSLRADNRPPPPAKVRSGRP